MWKNSKGADVRDFQSIPRQMSDRRQECAFVRGLSPSAALLHGHLPSAALAGSGAGCSGSEGSLFHAGHRWTPQRSWIGRIRWAFNGGEEMAHFFQTKMALCHWELSF